MSKVLEFKGDKYDFLEIIKYASDDKLSTYFDGDVTNINTGEVFDVSELRVKYDELNIQLLDNLEHMSPYQRKKILEYATKGYDAIREGVLTEKFNNDAITADECRELLSIQNNIKRSQVLKMRYESFYTVNKSKDKPEQLSDDYYGKFFRLIKFMSCRNRMEHIVNGKPIKKEDIMKHLGLKVSAFDIFLKKLEILNMITRGKIGKYKYIIINPAYANMQFQITYDIYKLFKSDMDDLLSPIEIKLLQLIQSEDSSPILQYE